LNQQKAATKALRNTPHSPRPPSGTPVEIIKEHPIKNRVFWMTLAVDPWHSREDDSRNGPGSRKEPQRPDTPGMLQS